MNNGLPAFLENKISLEVPLKYPEVYRVTYTPESPGPLTIEIRPSATSELQNTAQMLALQSPSDGRHSHALENEKTFVIAQSDNITPGQSEKYYYDTSSTEPESNSEILATINAIRERKQIPTTGNATPSR
ncbi:hypothetical protein J3R83DRAFT_13737 [Lanmaoa asiatica]|nr:hypothetical protein J3R83DRAFT_13737 [Lanmaoa asiatica]